MELLLKEAGSHTCPNQRHSGSLACKDSDSLQVQFHMSKGSLIARLLSLMLGSDGSWECRLKRELSCQMRSIQTWGDRACIAARMLSLTVAFRAAKSWPRLGSRLRRRDVIPCCTWWSRAKPPVANPAGSCFNPLADREKPTGLASAGSGAEAETDAPATAGQINVLATLCELGAGQWTWLYFKSS